MWIVTLVDIVYHMNDSCVVIYLFGTIIECVWIMHVSLFSGAWLNRSHCISIHRMKMTDPDLHILSDHFGGIAGLHY